MAKKKAPRRPPQRAASPSDGEWKPVFLAALRQVPIVRVACQEAGIVRAAAYQWRDKDPAFAKAWDQALEDGIENRVDVLEAALFSRAQKKSDVLLIFALKSLKPEIYGDRTRVDLTHHVKIDDVGLAFRAFVDAVKRHVSDEDTIRRIEHDFTLALKGSRLNQIAAPTPP